MKPFKLPIALILLICLSCCSCGTIDRPKFNDVDPRAKVYVDEYLSLSRQNNITFYHFVPVGIDKIDNGDVIGYCWTTPNWREVELDSDYFSSASDLSKKALVFHELTHCYCGRDHDFGDGQPYPDALTITKESASTVPWSLEANPPGYYDDGCAISIMHPFIQSDFCLAKHWNDYIQEMFDRCDPY